MGLKSIQSVIYYILFSRLCYTSAAVLSDDEGGDDDAGPVDMEAEAGGDAASAPTALPELSDSDENMDELRKSNKE